MASACCWLGVANAVAQPLLAPPASSPLAASELAAADEGSTPWRPPLAASQLPSDADLPMPADGAGQIALPGPVLEFDSLRVGSTERSVWDLPGRLLGPTPWEANIEFGLNGSTGTNESLSIRTGGQALRESSTSKLDLDATYLRTTESGASTQNNAKFDARQDWLLNESSPWTLFGTTNIFYDEFQDFDLQTTLNAGIGYRFIHVPGLQMIGRMGSGASREFGGPIDRWVPESLLGFEYKQRLSASQKVYGKLEYYPGWEDLSEYRLIADAGLEIALDQPSNLSLKLSATDRFDSTPGDADPHLVNYSVLLLLKL
jgi:putative salt-induced outer membrane protein YdiY